MRASGGRWRSTREAEAEAEEPPRLCPPAAGREHGRGTLTSGSWIAAPRWTARFLGLDNGIRRISPDGG